MISPHSKQKEQNVKSDRKTPSFIQPRWLSYGIFPRAVLSYKHAWK